MEYEDRKEASQLYTNEPPPFVDFGTGVEAAFCFKGDTYTEFIRTLFDECEKIDNKDMKDVTTKNDDDLKKIHAGSKKLSDIVAKFFKDNEHVKEKFAEDVTLIRQDKKGQKQLKMKLEDAFSQMLNQFFATLFKMLHGGNVPKKLGWTHVKIIPPKQSLENVKYRVNTVTQDDLFTILKMKESLKEATRIDARVTLTTKLALIKTEDETGMDEDKKKIYNDQIVPVLMKLIEKFFTNTLAQSDRSGIQALKQSMKDVCENSKIVTILDHLHSKATLVIPCYTPDQKVDDASDDSDVEFLETEHIPRQMEPPQMSCMSQQGWKLSQSIPIYNESEGSFVDFIEGTLAKFQRKHNILTYADRAISIWSVFREPAQQNKFLQKFGAFLNPASMKDQTDYIKLYIGVMKLFYPHQKKNSHDHEMLLKSPTWYKQKVGESIDDLVTRLQEQFDRAFPGVGIKSSQNKKLMAEILFDAFRDNCYRQFICHFHYTDFFDLCKLNTVVAELRKREQQQMEMRLRQERNKASHVKVKNVKTFENKRNENYHNNGGQRNSNGNSNQNQSKQPRQKSDNSGFRSYADVTKSNQSKRNKLINSNQFKEELERLVKNKNLHPRGDLRVPHSEIPAFIRDKPGFNINNYLPADKFKLAKEQAIKNIEQRRAEAAKQASSTKKNKRRLENNWKKKRVVVPPPNRNNYYGEKACNMVSVNRIPEFDTYMLNCSFGKGDEKTTFPALWDTDAML